ncbi:MAG TPA: DUF3667 domain-containing protein [Allosphingosinicella sp.]|jgi:hypothetical protein|nr:DUF3667 domain-containing protein [Allosphingosinicella sp.]
MSGIEGIGEAVTGGLVARAVEPQAGEARHQGGGNCLNCGAALAGPYCNECGQPGHVHRTLHAFWHDLLHGVLHFEGKIWRTLPLLAWRPGSLTRRYIDGERARFVSPLALFLFSVFLMFGVFGMVGGPFQMEVSASPEAVAGIGRDAAGVLRGRADGLERERRALAARGQPTADVDARLAATRRQLQGLESVRQLARPSQGGGAGEAGSSGFHLETGWAPLDRAFEHVGKNPSLFAYKLQSSAYKFSWALIPISVPFVWLMFAWRRRFKAYDHVVFVTYSLAFMTLMMVALSLIRPLIGSDRPGTLALVLLPPIHMYLQLKGAYALSRLGALWRTAALLVFAGIAGMLYFILLVGLGLLG